MTEVLPGAEPWSVSRGSAGALCIHGFTGNPTSMRPPATAFAAAGFSVEVPRLPGHGTSVDDMITTAWADWTEAAEAAYQSLAARCAGVVVLGQSMGGSLTLWLATRHPEIAGIVCVNPAVVPPPAEVMDMVRGMVAEGQDRMPGSGSDVAKPDAVVSSYSETPLVPLLSFMEGLAALESELGRVTSPLLLMTAPNDHVVPPTDSDALAAAVSSPVERVTLERSYHVATLDYDAEFVADRAVAFARKVTSA
jgi:carboxylesterase